MHVMTVNTFKVPFQMSSRESSLPRHSGFALIEVLVAVLILGVGLLGIAAMQSVSSQMTNGAAQRTQAVLLTSDMLDRIRANRSEINSYDGLVIDPEKVTCATDFTYNNGQSVAQNDIAEWGNLLACTLPKGEGTVNVKAATGAVTVWIDWQRQDSDEQDSDEKNGGQPVTVTTVI